MVFLHLHVQRELWRTSSGAIFVPVGNRIGFNVFISSSRSQPYCRNKDRPWWIGGRYSLKVWSHQNWKMKSTSSNPPVCTLHKAANLVHCFVLLQNKFTRRNTTHATYRIFWKKSWNRQISNPITKFVNYLKCMDLNIENWKSFKFFLNTSHGFRCGGYLSMQLIHNIAWKWARLIFSSNTGSVGGKLLRVGGLEDDFALSVFFFHMWRLRGKNIFDAFRNLLS